ncbi:DUF6525 family protein [uncultured Tateyamaria sp.]|uniref:DUF6525 family protein n=1 Tax=uncultured Tateyamaria sp. TaxID=455651 RepID=UPI0026141A5F|nr:DUF6525 family protein [uncultured Tateyamaria sp.]
MGQFSLHRKLRNGDPMLAYKGPPDPLRQWLSEAALLWSPSSVRQIWSISKVKGLTSEETLL